MTPAHASTARLMMSACFAVSLAACASSPAPASAPKPGSGASLPKSAAFRPDTTLSLCPSLTVSNAPPSNPATRAITGYAPFVKVENKVAIAVSPVNGACLTSGFGIRSTSPHKGVDYQVKPASMVHAAAAGRILEAGWRDDYGNYVVIDHGSGVFTRYAHLAALASGVSADKNAPFGMPLGVMGNSSKYTLPVHLHYEVLVGDYNTPKKSFGLLPVNVFGYPFERGLS